MFRSRSRTRPKLRIATSPTTVRALPSSSSTKGRPSPAGSESTVGSLGRRGLGISSMSSGVGRSRAMRLATERAQKVRPVPEAPTTTTWKRGWRMSRPKESAVRARSWEAIPERGAVSSVEAKRKTEGSTRKGVGAGHHREHSNACGLRASGARSTSVRPRQATRGVARSRRGPAPSPLARRRRSPATRRVADRCPSGPARTRGARGTPR